MGDEVDPTLIIERSWCAGKRIFAPVTDLDGSMSFFELTPNTVVTRNKHGIWEPVSNVYINVRALDVVITPLVAFDSAGHRIGMGGGYYDRCFRFLKNRRKWLKPKLIGVAFGCQEVSEIAADPWDIALYKVFSDHD